MVIASWLSTKTGSQKISMIFFAPNNWYDVAIRRATAEERWNVSDSSCTINSSLEVLLRYSRTRSRCWCETRLAPARPPTETIAGDTPRRTETSLRRANLVVGPVVTESQYPPRLAGAAVGASCS